MPLSHDVFFELNDGSPSKCEALVKDCYDYLKGHDGVMEFSAGTRALDCTRDINDLRFHVALRMLFADAASHDAYQVAPRHQEFIKRNKAAWKSVRVFDSTISSAGKR